MKIRIYKAIISEDCLDVYLVSEQLQNVPPKDSKLEYNFYPVTRFFIYNLECPLQTKTVLWISDSEGRKVIKWRGDNLKTGLICGFEKLTYGFNTDNMYEIGTYIMDLLLF